MDSKQNNQENRLLAINELHYVMPAPLSVSVQTTNKKQYSTRNEYLPSQTVVFDLNCNAAVDCEKSFITFKITCDAGTSVSFGSGSGLNVIREVRIMSKSGSELDRISNFNHWARHYMRNCVSQDEIEMYDQLWGFNLSTPAIALNQTQNFVFPLKFLSGLFRPHGGVKLPPQLLSGARIELVLESSDVACISPVGPQSTYKMLNPEISFAEHSLSDNVLKIISENAANNGLELTYDRVFIASESNGTTSQFNTQLKKAVSQCTSLIVEPKLTNLLNAPNFDSFNSITGAEFRKYQFRVASSYFPNQEVDEIKEAYFYASKICDRHKLKSYITYPTYSGAFDFHMASQIKSDDEITSSGLAINNSSSLAVNIEMDPLSTNAKTYFMYMTYTALARCFISQVSVKI
jgi:hypothetical protein